MKMQNAIATRTSTPATDAWLNEGRSMALIEGKAVFESLEHNHDADKATFDANIARMKALGAQRFEELKHLLERLTELGFDPARHASEFAKGRTDRMWAIALSAVNAVMAMLVFTLTTVPTWMAVVLGGLVLTTALPVAAFFEAHKKKDSLREGLFLTLSVLALLATFYLGSLRGLFMAALQSANDGPANAALHQVGVVLRPTLGLLTLASEALAGYMMFSARHRLHSPVALAVKRKKQLEDELSALHGSVKAAEAEPEIRLKYRTIGARQALANMNKPTPEPDNPHLRRAVVGALAALVVIAALLLFASQAWAQTNRPFANLLDLSTSQTDETLQANIEGIKKLLKRTPNGTRVVVLGVTDQFGHPRVLLDQQVRGQGGNGLMLEASREAAAAKWTRVSRELRPTYDHTSIIGALQLLPFLDVVQNVDIFIWSDAQENVAVNLSHVDMINVDKAMATLKSKRSIAQLVGARVYMLGVNLDGESATYVSSLKAFWTAYFDATGARLEAFRMDTTLQSPVR